MSRENHASDAYTRINKRTDESLQSGSNRNKTGSNLHFTVMLWPRQLLQFRFRVLLWLHFGTDTMNTKSS